jgi:hypothetical protein
MIRFVQNNNSEPAMVDFLVLSKNCLGIFPNKRHFREHFGATPALLRQYGSGWILLIPCWQRPSQFIYYGYCFGGSQQLNRAVAPYFWVESTKILLLSGAI